MDSKRISVVVRTKDEVKHIGEILRLVRSQAWDRKVEIIVVDSGSADGTLETLRNDHELTLIEIPPGAFTFGRSLNVGFSQARGDIIVSLSAHAFPSNGYWLANLRKHFDDPRVAGVYGKQLPLPGAWPPVGRDYLGGFYTDQPRVQMNVEDPRDHFFSNANSAIRRSCWEEHPFDETLPYCEDWEWARAMLHRGYRIHYEPEAAVFHSHNESLRDVCRRSYRESLAHKLLYGDKRMGFRNALRIWIDATLGDIRFIRDNGDPLAWLFWVPVYRLFWVYGQVRPHLRWGRELFGT